MRIDYIRANTIKHCSENKKERLLLQNDNYSAANINATLTGSPVKDCYCPSRLSFKGNIKASDIVLKADELVYILKNKLKPENFSTGKNYENVVNGTFCVNMHMHTTHSDGIMKVPQLLQQAVNYADYRKSIGRKDAFIFAITDHSNVDGAKEAVEIISQSPDKFKNMRFVPGVEFNSFYNNNQFELIAYCINPHDKNFNAFIENSKKQNFDYIDSLIKTRINPIEKQEETDLTTLEDMRKIDKYLNLGETPGLMYGFERALNNIFLRRHWFESKWHVIDKILQKHTLTYGNENINPGTPSIRQISDAAKKAGGFVGIAHPARDFEGIDFVKLFSDCKSMGVDAVESNYQYRSSKINLNPHFRESAEKASLLNTGGHDNHLDNIISNVLLADLPAKIRKIIQH